MGVRPGGNHAATLRSDNLRADAVSHGAAWRADLLRLAAKPRGPRARLVERRRARDGSRAWPALFARRDPGHLFGRPRLCGSVHRLRNDAGRYALFRRQAGEPRRPARRCAGVDRGLPDPSAVRFRHGVHDHRVGLHGLLFARLRLCAVEGPCRAAAVALATDRADCAWWRPVSRAYSARRDVPARTGTGHEHRCAAVVLVRHREHLHPALHHRHQLSLSGTHQGAERARAQARIDDGRADWPCLPTVAPSWKAPSGA
jgi:hypothetical protein